MSCKTIFATPVWYFDYPDFISEKEQILSCVYRIKEKDPVGVKRSNYNGYQSTTDLIDSTKYPELNRLFDIIGETFINHIIPGEGLNCNISITGAWANINDTRSCINIPHVHDDVFSGIFYVKAPDKSGDLVLQNNSLAQAWAGNIFKDKELQTDYSSTLKIKPQEGQFMIWHSYLTHFVLPNDHDDERISIAFNVDCLPKR